MTLLTVAMLATVSIRVTPFFSPQQGGPSFFVECRNSGTKALDPMALLTGAVRIDGKLHPVEGIGGSMLGGPPPPVAPGQSWREILILDQTEGRAGVSSAVFGAGGRMARSIPLSSGAHRVSFQCGDAWSKEVRFFWEPPPKE